MSIIWLLFTSTAPFEFYALIPHHPYKYLTILLGVVMFSFMVRDNYKIPIDVVVIILVVQAVYSLLTIFLHYLTIPVFSIEEGVIYVNLFIQLVVIVLCYVYIQNNGLMKQMLVSYLYLMAVMALLATVVFALGILVELEPVSFTVIPDHRPISNYIFSFSPGAASEFAGGRVIRVAGYFDEPGTFAFYITIALLLNKLTLRSKRLQWVYVLCGACTLSLAFFISLFLYFLIFSIVERKTHITGLLIGAIFVLVIGITQFRDESALGKVIYDLTLHRMQLNDSDDDKLIEGDNRSLNVSYAIAAFMDAPIIGQGKGAHSSSGGEYEGKICCNPMHPLATEGILGTVIFFSLIIYGAFLACFRRPFDPVAVGVWIIVFANLAQRPGFHAGSFGYFVFIFLLEATIWHKRVLYSRLRSSSLSKVPQISNTV
ncbi:hypothetical protein N9P94_00165 [Pseudomonadales bacterium]|nr:hypothetical protein [Pseudomonadales bacterium]